MLSDADLELVRRRDQAFGSGAPLFYDEPLHFVRGEGAYLFDASGRRYLDMYNNVPCVGHGNPRVVEAIARQQQVLNVHSRYLHESAILLAERLAALHGPQIESVMFSCSGTEGIEIALRMARFATGRRGIVCTDATYHGNSDLVSRLTRVGRSQPESEDIHAFPFPEKYRPPVEGLNEEQLCDLYLARLEDAIKRFEQSGVGFAALVVCSIFANEGLPDIPAGFMKRAQAMVHAAGGLIISDEVQAGYGRTGYWWGYEATGFTPDIVVTGKPMANGLPLAGTAASKALMDLFRARTRYFNTYASNPLQGVAGLAVLDEIEDRKLLHNVMSVGEPFKQALAQRKEKWDVIGDVRGHGLFLGVEIVNPAEVDAPDAKLAWKIANLLKEEGFLTNVSGIFGNVLKIRPPLVVTAADAATFVDALDLVMGKISQDL